MLLPIKDSYRIIFLLICLTLFIASCGGGGKNSNSVDTGKKETEDNTQPVITKSTPLKITETNAPYLAHLGFKLGLRLARLPNDYDAPAGKGATLKSLVASDSVIDTTKNIFTDIKALQSRDIVLLGTVVDCIGGGSFTHPNPLTFKGTYNFNNCIENGETTNGTFIIDGIGNIDNFKGTISYIDYSKLSGMVSNVTNGSFYLEIITDLIRSTFIIRNSLLTFTNGSTDWDLLKVFVINEKDFPMNLALAAVDYTLNINSKKLIGALTIKTTNSFQTSLDNIYGLPFSGKGVVYGAGNSRVKLTVKNGGTGIPSDLVIIEIDKNGQGYDPALTTEITWQDLNNI